MHTQRIEIWKHKHNFNLDKKGNEDRTKIVVVITFITMIAEITFGWLTNSMALFADGWHMGTHAFALGISVLAYILARKYSKDERFAFGTWKIEILGAFSSAVVLGMVGIIMGFTSVERLFNPLPIHFDQALMVTFLGLAINVACAIILNSQGGHTHGYGDDAHGHSHGGHSHGQEHSPEEGHQHPHHEELHEHSHDDHDHDHSTHGHEHAANDKDADLNLRSAYLHVFADAMTSVLAILALAGAKYFGFNWLDPFMGIVGAGLIFRWSISLLKDTSVILLDRETNSALASKIKERIESDQDTKVSDLHLWKVEQTRYACIIALVTGTNCSLDDFKKRLNGLHELVHVTIEVNPCQYNLS